MRCLYCGKELALLKRWTGGGEFCSDAHRQQYQEEYNQLALNRLLQAKPKADLKQPDAKAPDVKASDARQQVEAKTPAPKIKEDVPAPPLIEAQVVQEPEPAEETVEVPLAREDEPDLSPEPEIEEEIAPAEAYGFLLEFPVPVDVAVVAAAGDSGGFDQVMAPELPRRETAAWDTALLAAPQVAFAPCMRVMDCVASSGERRLELREFARSLPAFKFDAHFNLAPDDDTGLLEISEESMDILIFPQPPQESAALWLENATPFGFGHELGALARATFHTTGVEDKDDALDPMPADVEPEQILDPAKVAIVEPPAPARVAPPVAAATAAPVVPAKVVSAPIVKPAFFRPAQVASTAVETPAETPAPKKPESVPDVMTRPLPLTLHGLTAGKGKPVQVFQTAVAGDLEIQAPRSSALPLRPVMTLGPAPAPHKTEERKPSERTVLVKPDPRKSPQGRPDPRFANGKGRKPEPRPEPDVQAPVPAPVKEDPKPVPELVDTVAAPKPAPAEIKKPAPPPAERKLPEPVARPDASLDLGLPKLTLESGGFWSKLSPPAKIGIAAAVVVAVIGVAILALRGSGSAVVASGPQVVAGSPLPAMESGWITDFGAETGVRRDREISILRPSLNLSDYRLEFQAQIEGGKALGWVFRAKDGKNFYVSKLEVTTPGLEPKVAVTHFAVIDGQAQPHAQTPLPMKVRIDTLYKIRFDAVGDHFSTWVQDEKVDDWTDDHLKMGGVGLYSDKGETMPRPRMVSVVPLVIKR